MLPPEIFNIRPISRLLLTTFANAAENALPSVEQSCIQYPALEARRLQEEYRKAFCFTRKATGEVVCPN